MQGKHSRRVFLATVGTALGGCLTNSSQASRDTTQADAVPFTETTTTATTTPEDLILTKWTQYNANASNNRFLPSVSGLSDSLREVWRGTGGEPYLMNGVLYTFDGGQVTAREPLTGDAYWSRASQVPPALSPTRVVCGDESTLIGYNLEGQEQWKYQTGGAEVFTPTVLEDSVYAGSYGEATYRVGIEDGVQQEIYDVPCIEAEPLVTESAVYVQKDVTGGKQVVKLSRSDGTKQWSTKFGSGSLRLDYMVADGHLFLADAHTSVLLTALSTKDGTRVSSLPTQLYATEPVVTDNGVIAADFKQMQKLAPPNSQSATGSEWSVSFESTVYTTTVVDDTVYVGLESGDLYALNRQDGSERWRFTVPDSIYEVVPTNKVVYVATEQKLLAISDRDI